MEALGSAATIFAVVSIVDQLADRVKQLYNFWSAVSEAPGKIQAIASDVNLLLSIVVDISNHEQKYGIDALMTDALENCACNPAFELTKQRGRIYTDIILN